MKGYFNKDDKIRQMLVTMSLVTMRDIVASDVVTESERKQLKNAIKYIENFNNSVFERLGDGYKRSLYNLSKDNTLRLVTKGSSTKCDFTERIDDVELQRIVDEISDIDCCGCKNEYCLNCAIYRMKSHLGYQGINDETNLCPFRKPKQDYDFDVDEF